MVAAILRTARASLGNLCYHVINRGNGRSEVFHKSLDYTLRGSITREYRPSPDAGLAYSVAPNHFHAALRERDVNRMDRTAARPGVHPSSEEGPFLGSSLVSCMSAI